MIDTIDAIWKLVGPLIGFAVAWATMRADQRAMKEQLLELKKANEQLTHDVAKLSLAVAVLEDRDERGSRVQPTGRHAAVDDDS